MIWTDGRKAFAVALVVVALFGAVCLPLFTYTLSLALFGLAHVLSELRYVDARFSFRLVRRLRIGFLIFLSAIVLNRLLYAVGLGFHGGIELILVAGLAALVLPECIRAGLLPAFLAVATLVILFLGIGAYPAQTLLFFAIAHNFTPIGFLAERLKGRERTVALALCSVVFGLIPALIATGAISGVLERLMGLYPDLAFFSGDALKNHIKVYVPAAWFDSPIALRAFSAAVFTQCMHYAVVIGVLPGLIDAGPERTLARWPKQPAFAAFLWIGSAAAFVLFCVSFNDARTFYSIPAAVHAWIEIPLLLLATTGFGAGAGSRATT
ncbi:MAG TPA: hypothetical protein VK968_06945 [Roseimicrobium sp.]|nr:hypothetical protein [Roseimicrobium sp.]